MKHSDFNFQKPVDKCVACNSSNISFAFTSFEADWSVAGFKNDKCHSCGTVFVNPRPTGETLGKYYASVHERFPNHTKTSLSYYTSLARRKQFVKDYLSPILKVKGGGSHFDFGAGAGWLMRLMQDLGFETEGVDLMKTNIEAGQSELGLKGLKYGDIVDIPEKKYDVFTGISTIEHVLDPAEFVRIASSRVKDDGILAMVFPDMDSVMAKKMGEFYYWNMPPYHLTLFTRDGMQAMLNQAGFSKVDWAPIQRSWKWTYSVVQKLKLSESYLEWRKDPKFVEFDIAIDELMDDIAHDQGFSSNVMVIAQK